MDSRFPKFFSYKIIERPNSAHQSFYLLINNRAFKQNPNKRGPTLKVRHPTRGVHGLPKPFKPTQTGPIFGRTKPKILNRFLIGLNRLQPDFNGLGMVLDFIWPTQPNPRVF